MDLSENELKTPKNLNFTIANDDFNCRVLGTGKKIIIAFHGFGQDGNVFQTLSETLPDYTIYAVDLPFHGNTKTDNIQITLSEKSVISLTDKLINSENIKEFSLIGFSIGARLLFPIISIFSLKIQKIIFIAPDGISESVLYRLATGTSISRRLFRSLMRSEYWVNSILSFISTLKLSDQNTLIFIGKTLEKEEFRERVYKTWIYLRKLKMNKGAFLKSTKNINCKIHFIFGNRDEIISKQKIVKIVKTLPNSYLEEIQSNHQYLVEAFTEYARLNTSILD